MKFVLFYYSGTHLSSHQNKLIYFVNGIRIDSGAAFCYTYDMIRNVTAADRALFLQLSEEFYASPAVAHPVPSDFHVRAFDELMRSDAYALGYILCDGEMPAGYALLAKTYSREGGGICIWIEEIYLRPAFRGKGLAKEFFSFAETLGAARLRLEAEPDNARAIGLYRALGYEPLPYLQMIKERKIGQ